MTRQDKSDQTQYSLPSDAADKLISAHDGEVALLYIYRLRTGSSDLERAAAELCRTMKEMEAADEKLRRLRLFPDDITVEERNKALNVNNSQTSPSPRVLPPADELPEYSAEDVIRLSKDNGEFSAILSEAKRIIGRGLSSVDMKVLMGIYDFLHMPADVIMLLLNYCGRQYEEKFHGQRRPTARAIQKEAFYWVNRGVETIEQAEEFISFQEHRRSELGQVKEALGIKGRELTKTENEYISSWLDMGYKADAIAVAYDRTVTNVGSLKWSYMDSIIKRWKEKELFTPQEIEEKDGRRKSQSPPRQGKSTKPMDYSDIDNLLDKI